MEDFKPCPICGGKPEFKFVSVDNPVTNFDNYYQVGCESCRIYFRYSVRFVHDETVREKAIIGLAEKWNKRYDSLSKR